MPHHGIIIGIKWDNMCCVLSLLFGILHYKQSVCGHIQDELSVHAENDVGSYFCLESTPHI